MMIIAFIIIMILSRINSNSYVRALSLSSLSSPLSILTKSSSISLASTSSTSLASSTSSSTSSTSSTSSSTSSSSSKSLPAQYLSNHRFWSRTLYIETNNNNITLTNLQYKLDEIEYDLKKVEVGIAIIDEKTLIPIQSGKLQLQHTVSLDGKLNTNDAFSNNIKVKAFVCAFAPRAETVCIAPNEEERPIDLERLKCLDQALLHLTSTTAEELLSEKMAGTPPARIYRSFVSPRPKAVHILEPTERAANRTAAQIELALRQVRADQASYLRNTDKALQSVFQTKSKSDNDANNNDIEEYQTNNQNEFQRKTINPMIIVLDNVRSAFNVGSLFRTGETAGIAELITVGITCRPPHPKLRKTALSSMDVVPSRHFDDIMDCIETLKMEGYTIITMETTEKSKLYTEVEYPKNCAFILGNEVTGVDTRVMDKSDLIVEIPTFGVKNSLNVASAAPIVLFECLRQWNKK